MLYVYAVVDADAEPPLAGRGLDCAPLRSVAAGGVAAVVSEHASLAAQPSEEAVLRHADVVERIAGSVPAVLPARFGDVLPDEASVEARLRERATALRDALDGVRGCVEIGLRVAARGETEPPVPPPARPAEQTGSGYMHALRQRAAVDEPARAIHEPLAALSVRSVVGGGSARRLLLTAAYLVRRDAVASLESEVARLRAAHPGLAFVTTGPWPPYSFVAPEVRAP